MDDAKRTEILKRILCPNCRQGIHLEAQDFKVTTDNERGEWSCDPAITCPWECGVEFFVTFSQIEYVKK
jgi:hypothetical protein